MRVRTGNMAIGIGPIVTTSLFDTPVPIRILKLVISVPGEFLDWRLLED